MKALTSPDLSKGEEKELKNIVWSSESPPLLKPFGYASIFVFFLTFFINYFKQLIDVL